MVGLIETKRLKGCVSCGSVRCCLMRRGMVRRACVSGERDGL